jgi:PAS domain S-box-containing protein
MPAAKLLIVDDDQAQTEILCGHLEPEGYTTKCLTSATEALAMLREQPFDLLLTGLHTPEMDGIGFLRQAREIDPDLVGIIMTRHDALDYDGQMMEAGALDYIVKPFTRGAILPVLSRALAGRRLRLENIHLQQAVGIYELSMVIQLTLGFDVVLQKVADAAMGHNQVSGVSILVPVEDGKALRVAVSRGDDASENERKHIPFTRALSRWVDRSLKRVSRLNELADMEAALPLARFHRPGSTSIAMLSGGRFVGILNFTSKNPGRPVSPEQIKALNILAGAAAAALQAASLIEQLQNAEKRYRSLSERAADIIIRYELQPQPHVAYVNPAFASVIGYSPDEYYADPELILNIVHPDDRLLKEAILRGDFLNGSTVTLRCINREGKTVWLEQRNARVEDSDGRLIAIEGIARDITERQNLEEQLRQSQKMEAIGVLAGGLAHDFNNMLTVIIGYSDMILTDDAPPSHIAEKLHQVKKAAELATSLTGQLLALGRKQLVRRQVLDVNAVVETCSKILRRSMGADIELIITLDTGLLPVNADPGQIEQILMNLALNARSSMPQGGKIVIETKNCTLAEPRLAAFPVCTPGPYVMIAVTDSGCGMDAATRARIFEPFYTTKVLGQGTGLGLSIVYGIVRQNAGDIRVFSEPGKGTRVEILLPCAEQIEERTGERASPVASAVSSTVPTESGMILVVEDDPDLRQLIGTVLHKAGYTVRIARDGDEALCICEQQEGKVELVLTDMVMPGISGPAMLDSLMRLNHGLKVLYMSGYAGDAVAAGQGLDPCMPLIQKPFAPQDLICRIREVLAESTAAVPAVSPVSVARADHFLKAPAA